MGRTKIRQLTFSAWSVTFFAILLIVMLLFWMTYRFLQPFPPKTLTMTTGMPDGSYAAFGEAYRQVLARDGIHVVLRPTSGATERLRLLKDRSQAVDTGFIQSNIESIEESSNLMSLGSLAYTPLWVFYRGKDTYDDLSQLAGKQIAIGPKASGARKYSLELLKIAGVTSPPAEFFELPFTSANQALVDGKVEVIMTFGSPDTPLILEMLKRRDIKLMSMGQAEAYTRRLPDFSHVVLPRGVIDPAKGNPPSEVDLLSPTTNLIVRKELHPALVYLLLKASVEIHGGAGWLHKAGEFPNINRQDDPISDQAQRFYKSGGSWLYAYLPYWAATFAERLTLILIPLGMIIVPLIGIAPWIYTWRNRSKYYPWYRELRNLEKEIRENGPIDNIEAYGARLDRIEDAVNGIRTSVAFYDELFILKEHIQILRRKLDILSHGSPGKTDDPPPEKPG